MVSVLIGFLRFIPAPAGNSFSCASLTRSFPVHPRACGEQLQGLYHACMSTGSSPRLRGTERSLKSRESRKRFIPAPAGNSSLLPLPSPSFSVHPRACGEQSAAAATDASRSGSSPRLRGTVATDRVLEPLHRFIPAPAGNRQRLSRWAPPSTVHPRACGEQPSAYSQARPGPGSSPRLRGTEVNEPVHVHPCRFIPAPAGNSACRGPCQRAEAVHPRACGEQLSQVAGRGTKSGSSPRLRGTASEKRHDFIVPRFIPAPAGNRGK